MALSLCLPPTKKTVFFTIQTQFYICLDRAEYIYATRTIITHHWGLRLRFAVSTVGLNEAVGHGCYTLHVYSVDIRRVLNTLNTHINMNGFNWIMTDI